MSFSRNQGVVLLPFMLGIMDWVVSAEVDGRSICIAVQGRFDGRVLWIILCSKG